MVSSLHARAAAAPTWLRGLPSSRPCHVLPALCGALLLGAGTGCALTVLRLRGAAAEGLPDLPASSALLIAGAGLLGLLLSGARVGPRAAGLLAGTSAAGAVVLALLSEWVLARRLSTPGGFVVAMAVPALLTCLAIGFAARAHRGRAAMLAALLGGAGVALWLVPHLLAGAGLASGLRIAAIFVLVGGGLLAVRGFPPPLRVSSGPGFASGCLLAASFGFTAPPLLDGARAAGVAIGGGEGVLLAGLGFGVVIAAVSRLHERAQGLWPSLLLLPVLVAGLFRAPAGAGAACLALALLGIVTGPVLLAALGGAGARAGTALAVGLAIVVLGSFARLPPAWLAPAAALLAGLLLLRLSWLPLPALVLGLTLLPLLPRAPHDPSVIATAGDGSVHYRRCDQGIELRCRGRTVDVAGPDHRHGELVAHLGQLLQPAAAHTAVLGLGTGRAVRALGAWQEAGTVALVGTRPSVLPLWTALQNDGPVAPVPFPFQAQGNMVLQAGGVRAWLTALPTATLDLALMPEALCSDEPWLGSEECHALLRTRLGRGLLLQTFRCDATLLPLLRASLAAAAAVHPWCGVFLVGETLVLAAAGRAPDLAAAGRLLEATPPSLRWLLHRAGLGAGPDLQLAFLGELRPGIAVPLTDDGVAGHLLAQQVPAAVAAVLRAAITDPALTQAGRLRLCLRAGSATERTEALRGLAALRCEHPDSVLLRREELRFAVADAVEAIVRLDPADPGAPARGAQRAAALLHIGCPTAVLQAALALPDRTGEQVAKPAVAAAKATALDPTIALHPPGVLARILREAPRQSPLEDFAVLPADADLWRLCAGDEPQAVALRVRFPSDCARALVQRWQQVRMAEGQLAALRELADPFVIEAAAVALGRERRREVVALWRFDLPLPPALGELARGEVAERLLLAQALPGRRDPASLLALALLLADQEYSVRLPAAAALVRSLGERVAYDPEWPPARLRQAAEQVRALHNRTP